MWGGRALRTRSTGPPVSPTAYSLRKVVNIQNIDVTTCSVCVCEASIVYIIHVAVYTADIHTADIRNVCSISYHVPEHMGGRWW